MAVDILFFKEDLLSQYPSNDIDSIESDNNLYEHVQKIAAQQGFIFIECIDPYGVTLFNKKQLDPLEKEITAMRSLPDVNQKTLDILETAVKKARTLDCYIMFFGD